jgi:hypothetical protein
MGGLSDFVKAQASAFVDSGVNSLLGKIFGSNGEASEGFSVNRMVASIDKSGIALTNHFEVFVHGPTSGDDMKLRIDSIDIPGRSFAPIDHKFTNMGPVNRIPGQQFYSDVTATIILSEDMREKDYFEAWQEKMVNTGAYETGTDAKTDAANDAAQTEAEENLTEYTPITSPYNFNYANSPFTHRYFDNYIGTVAIRQYGPNGDLRSVHTLREAYPISIAPISMNWGTEEVARMQVTFAYRNYKAVFNKADQPGMGAGFFFNFGKGGLKLGGRIPGIGNISYAKGAGFTGSAAPLQKKIFSSIGL